MVASIVICRKSKQYRKNAKRDILMLAILCTYFFTSSCPRNNDGPVISSLPQWMFSDRYIGGRWGRACADLFWCTYTAQLRPLAVKLCIELLYAKLDYSEIGKIITHYTAFKLLANVTVGPLFCCDLTDSLRLVTERCATMNVVEFCALQAYSCVAQTYTQWIGRGRTHGAHCIVSEKGLR